jgi:predicted RNase H-like HicB family nuclease
MDDVNLRLPLATIMTFQGKDIVSEEWSWVAMFYNPANNMAQMVNFHGKTENEAREMAVNWWRKTFAIREPRQSDLAASDSSGHRVASVEGGCGRGKVFIGKKWMINRKTKERARVAESDIATYQANGFEFGKKL